MSEIITISLQYIAPVIIGALLTYLLAPKKKGQDLISEEIEEITNADGSKIKKAKRKFK